ncbi:MAG: tetratricopeptide repeat protein [Candidatus Omnitrophica bacterium]|nr:tetratricopeptide repeat protein [Candidatus Omnitrophota bacterium]MDD5351782.1 tetratricopeptide repeat protein [Candidatus Omnitrophota bacterium]
MRRTIFIIILVVFVAYFNSRSNAFVGDDNYVVVRNSFISSWKNFPSLFTKNYLSDPDTIIFDSYHRTDYGSSEITYRPVVTLSYMVDYALWRLYSPGFHLTSILLHTLNAILLYLFVLTILKNHSLALFSSLFFAVHPINTEAVNYISAREELLVVFFLLSAFMLYVYHKRYDGPKRIICYLGSCFSFCLALFSKEMAITFPILIMLYDFYFEFNASIKEMISKMKYRYLGYIAVAVFYLIVYFFVFSPRLNLDMVYAGGSIHTHLFTSLKILARYVTAFFIPFNISIVPSFYAPVAKTFNYEVLLSAVILALLAIMALRIYRYSKLASFGIMWFFITILPVSNLIIHLVNMFSFRYMYLPAVGLCLALSAGCVSLANAKFIKSRAPNSDKIILIAVTGIFLTGTLPQNLFWKSEYSFGKNQIMYYPGVPEPYQALSKYYFEQGDYGKSIAASKVYLKYFPDSSLSYNDIGVCCLYLGRLDEAVSQFKNAIKFRPNFTDAHYNLGIIYLNKNEFYKAIDCFNRAIALDPNYADAYNNLAVAYLKLGKYKEGRKFLVKTLELCPNHELATGNLKSLEESKEEEKK